MMSSYRIKRHTNTTVGDTTIHDYVSSPVAARVLGTDRRERIASALAKLESTPMRAADELEIVERFLARLNSHEEALH